MNQIEQEQYALVHYLLHAKPGPVLEQIAQERIKWLEEKKYRVSKDPEKLFYSRTYNK